MMVSVSTLIGLAGQKKGIGSVLSHKFPPYIESGQFSFFFLYSLFV